ncbi:MAG: hypothetical protein J7513_02675 [Solirubrobacteraceae bacterium]|nr:hypothetical protein [Solirubrobacteraceae bacterium]
MFHASARALAVTLVSGSLIAAAPAAADAPAPKRYTINPVSSIGGVKLGMPYAAALAAWGKGSDCQEQDEAAAAAGHPIDRSTMLGDCSWRDESKPGTTGARGRGTILFKDGKVRQIAIFAQQNSKYIPTSKGPLGKFKVKGTKYGLGSPVGSIQKKLKGKGTSSGVGVTKGGKYLNFSSSGGKVSDISLGYSSDR